MSAVFILVATQFSIALSELRVSRLYERFSGLYEIGVSTANAMTRSVTSDILAMDIIREYIDTYDWESKSEFRDGVFILSGDEFYRGYQKIAKELINTPQENATRITHNSGVEINIESTFVGIGTVGDMTASPPIRPELSFTIIITNYSQRPTARSNSVFLEGVISWSIEPPVYILEPRFDIDEDTIISEKSYHDFFISQESDFIPVELSLLYRD